MPKKTSTDLAPGATFTSDDFNDKTLQIKNLPTAPLTVGTYRFRLVVTDDAGNKSTNEAIAVVNVLDDQAPTAIINLEKSTLSVVLGQDILLDGSPSRDVGGQVRVWSWVLESMPMPTPP